MNIITLLTQVKNTLPKVDNLVITGVSNKDYCELVFDSLEPVNTSVKNTLIKTSDPFANTLIAYNYEIKGNADAVKAYQDNSIDVVVVFNDQRTQGGAEIQDSWYPKLTTGGYLICFDYFSELTATLTEITNLPSEYPTNWYKLK